MAAKSQSRTLAKSPSPKSKVGKSESQKRMNAQKEEKKDEFLEGQSSYEEFTEIEEEASIHGDSLLTSKRLTRYVVLVTMLLASVAAMMTLLCYVEEKNVNVLLEGVAEIRKFLISQNISHTNQTDPEVLHEASRYVEILIEQQRRNAEISQEIDDVQKFIKGGGHWHYNGRLLYFTAVRNHFELARVDCEERNASLVKVTDEDFENYVESHAKKLKQPLWIGLRWHNNGWEWLDGERLTGKTFWAQGEPKLNHTGACVNIGQVCCWYSLMCLTIRGWACEKIPDPKYLT